MDKVKLPGTALPFNEREPETAIACRSKKGLRLRLR